MGDLLKAVQLYEQTFLALIAHQGGHDNTYIGERRTIFAPLLQVLSYVRHTHVQNVKETIENLNTDDGQLLVSEWLRLALIIPNAQVLTSSFDKVLSRSNVCCDPLRFKDKNDLYFDSEYLPFQNEILTRPMNVTSL